MPIYEYKCYNEECGHTLEELESLNSFPFRICPKCNFESMKRIISAGHFKFENMKQAMWTGDTSRELRKMYKGFKKK